MVNPLLAVDFRSSPNYDAYQSTKKIIWRIKRRPIYQDANPSLPRLLGFLPHGAYG